MQEKPLKKSALKKQQMIDVAESMIAEQGVGKLTVRNIASEMGCAVGLLYRLFESLDAVVMAVNMRTLQALEKHILSAAQDMHGAAAYLEAMGQAYVDYVMHHTQRWQAVTGFQFSGDIPEDYAAQQKRLFDVLEAQIAVLHPKMDAQAVALEARALWVGMEGLAMLATNGKLDGDGDLSIQAIVHVLLARFLAGVDREVRVAQGVNHGA